MIQFLISKSEGIAKARKGEPLTLDEYIASHLGFLPGECERLEVTGAAALRNRRPEP